MSEDIKEALLETNACAHAKLKALMTAAGTGFLVPRPLDAMIGRLDRLLSEFLVACADPSIDEADRQTLKHHADDLVGVGNAGLKKLGL
jgi:hypothetical protein